MKASAYRFYQLIQDRKVHASVIYFTAATIILVSLGGVVSSVTIGAIVLLGLCTILFDADAREALLNPKDLRPLTILLACVLVWQALGLLLRSPADKQAASVLGSAVGIAMLLPLLVAAVKRDAAFRSRLLAVLFILGCIAAALSLARYFILLGRTGHLSIAGLLHERLVPIGRANHQILGSGGLAACFFAALAVYPKAPSRRKSLVVAGLLLITLTIVLTQSRGPMIGMGLALAAAATLEMLRTPASRVKAGLLLAPLCFAIPVTLIIVEPWIKDWACTSQLSMCRPSNRQDVWSIVAGMIRERPWFGIGPTFRFAGGAVSHPHNGLLGLTFYFGLPMAAFFLGIVAFAVKRAAAASPSPSRTFALLGIFFSMSFVATDLSNPFAFVNTLYLYLWLPVFIGSVPGSVAPDDRHVMTSTGNALGTLSRHSK